MKKIYAENFQRFVSAQPKALNVELAMAELDRLAMVSDALGTSPNMARRVAETLAA